MFFTYDLLYSNIYNNKQLRSLFDYTYFFKNSYFQTNYLLNINDNTKKLTRLETSLIIDNIDKIERIQVGDFNAKGAFFINSFRAGGIQIGTNFKLNPTFITYPLPDFAGSTAIPSTIDIYIENTKIYSNNLNPGPFEIKDIPVLSPEGNLKIVIKDILGRVKVVNLPYITSHQLLKEGLSEYAISVGALRKNFQLKDFAYGRLFLNTFYKKGLTNKISLETGAYLENKHGYSFGLSPIFLTNSFGTVKPELAFSYNNKTNSLGNLYGFSYSKKFKYINFNINYLTSDKEFVKPISVYGYEKENIRLFSGIYLPKIGNIGISYLDRKYYSTLSNTISSSKNINVSFTRMLFNRIILSLTYSFNKLDGKNNNLFRGIISMPLGGQIVTSLQYQNNDNQHQINLNYSLNKKSSKGLYSRGSFYYLQDEFRLENNLSYDFEKTSTYLGISYSSKKRESTNVSYRTGISGSIILLDGDIYLRRKIERSFAIIKIEPPVENVEVKVNNRLVGKTTKNGTLFLPYLSPYYPNEIRINPDSLDMKTIIKKNITSFIPYEKHGYVLKFESQKVNSIRLKIFLPNQEFPPAGIDVNVDGKKAGIVGFKGKTYIENITEGKHIISIDYMGKECKFTIEIKNDTLKKIIPFIGNYTCKIDGDIPIIAKKNTKNKEKIIKKQNKFKKKLTSKSIDKIKRPKSKENEINYKSITIKYDDFEDLEDFLIFRENLKFYTK